MGSRARYGFTKHWAKLFEESKATSKMHRQGGTAYEHAEKLEHLRSQADEKAETLDEPNVDEKAKALRNMRDVVAQATAFYGQLKSPLRMSSEDRRLAWLHHGSNSDDMRSSQRLLTRIEGLEMVGMVPKSSLSLVLSDSIIRDLLGDSKDIDSLVKQIWQPGMPLLSTPEKLDTFDASVQALGVLSRETLQDDARGSLRKQIVMRYGNGFFDKASRIDKASRYGYKFFDVFAIEGLVDAPGLSISAARVFMSNIAQYAQQEQKVVVVPDRAYLGHHGPDLTEYYERLGFQKVEMQGYAPAQVLLYVGFPRDLSPLGLKMMAEDSSVENEQIMVSMNLWTGLAGM